MKQPEPIRVAHLFRPLDESLIQLLASLREEDWGRQTPARDWKVKDVVSHLLDGNLRVLSIQQDGYAGEAPPEISSYTGLVDWLNQLNADWIKATKRISPGVLILLHRATGHLVSQYYESLDPDAPAIFPVAWAGESESRNWMHLAREYTEKWHHQQQIREAVGKEGIMTRQFFYPLMDTFMRALPVAFRGVDAPAGTTIRVRIPTPVGGEWSVRKSDDGWHLVDHPPELPAATVEIQPAIAWKLFCKNIRPADVSDQVRITGNAALGQYVLSMVSVMA